MSFPCSRTQRSCSALSRAKRMTIACRSGLARPPTQCSGSVRAGVPERLGPGGHALLELLRKRRQRSLVQSERAQAVPGESRRHPPLVLGDAGLHRSRRMNRLLDRRHPRAAAGCVAKRQKFVARRERRGARQKEVLDVGEFEHRDVPLSVCLFQTGAVRWGCTRFTRCGPTPVRRSSTHRRASKTYMRGCRSGRRFGP